MIVCHCSLQGRIGNNLFNIAAVWSHCKKNNYSLTIYPSQEGVSLSIYDTILHKVKGNIAPPPPEYTLWNEPHFHYHPIPSEYNCIYGYFQSSKYFSDISDEIRVLFDPPTSFKEMVLEKYSQLLHAIQETVVIHVRRGDYLNAGFLNICRGKTTYYENAMKIMSEKIQSPNYIVFSDDIGWCKEQDIFRNCTFVEEQDPEISLYLMSCFKNFIIPNSTLSWWGAWLADPSIVVAPDRWFLDRITDYQDIYEPSWILCSIE